MKNGIQELGDMANDNCTHHFIINSENIGKCIFCNEVRDFGRLLQREGVFVVARRGAKARKVLGKKRKRRLSPYEKRITF